MKLRLIILAAALTLGASALAQDAPFAKAQSAYDAGRYAEAVMLYDGLLADGVSNAEVHYNLANACFKDSDLPKAVWHYRKASYLKPRDADIRANLRFALNAAGAVEPAPGFIERVFAALSNAEWMFVAIAGYATLALLLALATPLKSARRFLLKLCLVPVAALAFSAAGWWHWRQLALNPEWVVTRTEATALFGPVEGSTAHYKPPLGALARQINTDPKGWVELEYDGKQGWLKTEDIKRVSP